MAILLMMNIGPIMHRMFMPDLSGAFARHRAALSRSCPPFLLIPEVTDTRARNRQEAADAIHSFRRGGRKSSLRCSAPIITLEPGDLAFVKLHKGYHLPGFYLQGTTCASKLQAFQSESRPFRDSQEIRKSGLQARACRKYKRYIQ